LDWGKVKNLAYWSELKMGIAQTNLGGTNLLRGVESKTGGRKKKA